MAYAESSQRLRRILIIKPSSLGDIIHALPVLAALREAHPQAHIAWLAATSFAPLLQGHPLLDEVIPFDRARYGRMLRSPGSLFAFWRFIRDLRQRRFDLVLDLQGLFRSGFLALASGAAQCVGFADARELAGIFYSQRVPGSRKSCHAVEMNLRLARALGLTIERPAFPLGLGADDVADARKLLTNAAGRPIESFIAVVPGARWDTKRWPGERLGRLIDRLASEGLPTCVLLGGPDDRVLATDLRSACQSPMVDLVGRTSVRELAAVIALADMVITHDSGPMHIAAALEKPLLAIFGPTNPARTGPWCDSARIVSLPLDCAPCYKRCCPLGHHNCMRQLDVEAVLRPVRELYAGATPLVAGR